MLCPICERGCHVPAGANGACGRYANTGEAMVERYPDRYLVTSPISVETIPLLHFHPGAPFLQVSTIGCNFDCPGCISTVTAREMRPDSPALRHLSPESIVAMATSQGCAGIAFLMNDPLASYQTFVRVAQVAKSQGLLVGCASNAYFTETSLQPLLGLLDCINIGVKGMTAESMRTCGGGDPGVVLRNIRLLVANGVHVEIACMDRSDNREDTRRLAQTLAEISPTLVLQLMRFVPIESADPALEPPIADTEAFAATLRHILPFTYVFNTPGTRGLDTVCPECGETIVRRDFYGPMGARLLSLAPGVADTAVACGRCGSDPAIKGPVTPPALREGAFQGGYPFTRGLEIVESMCLAMGATTQAEVVGVWEHLLAKRMLPQLHQDIQTIDGYFRLIRQFGDVLGRNEKADWLVEYLSAMIAPVLASDLPITHRPRTYYAMGKPLFAIKGDRFENHLVGVAGGDSVNTSLELEGRPGITIAAATLKQLDPEVIFISSFISNDPKVFCQECKESGIDVSAVRSGRVHTAPIPTSDFGAPKWVLGLRYLANMLHPDRYSFDIEKDARDYHRHIFGQDFPVATINRSFAKPNRFWRFTAGAPSAAG